MSQIMSFFSKLLGSSRILRGPNLSAQLEASSSIEVKEILQSPGPLFTNNISSIRMPTNELSGTELKEICLWMCISRHTYIHTYYILVDLCMCMCAFVSNATEVCSLQSDIRFSLNHHFSLFLDIYSGFFVSKFAHRIPTKVRDSHIKKGHTKHSHFFFSSLKQGGYKRPLI